MPTITFKLGDGTDRAVKASNGSSVMITAVRNDITGIVAECGGSMACGTCHVYIDPSWADRLPPASPEENDVLDMVAAGRRPESRLACQIVTTEEVDGLVVHLPDRQM
ncbi:2Fe-2S iron-sulfur cluster-binding protein [Chelativorans alearense]|uniref:2Fe-2S iron-sulfur cluster-binding protein n=1 Tax=Chelativorans alearense TaxID=2681495 RepID=UPI0013D3698A|nr:2Fe-2S iron-sulfur cluster-binding protein [Chelativorans alearense]